MLKFRARAQVSLPRNGRVVPKSNSIQCNETKRSELVRSFINNFILSRCKELFFPLSSHFVNFVFAFMFLLTSASINTPDYHQLCLTSCLLYLG